MINKAFAPALLALALSACAVGPDYKAPESEPARLASAEATAVDRSHFESLWWQQFDDPTLNQLVQQSLEQNRELRVAFARLRAARAIRDDVGNDQLPVITSRAAAQGGKAQQPGQTEDRVTTERYDLGLDMAWELDLFGRIQRQIEASDAEAGAAQADLQQLQVSLIAELVDAYGTLRGAQLREGIARENLKNQQESRGLTEQLRDAGVGSELDVLRADGRLAATEATLPQLQAIASRARNRIATLLGQRPDQLSVDLSPKPLPVIAKQLPIGDPAELLRRRPDVAAAERRLAAATANVGVATADLFPGSASPASSASLPDAARRSAPPPLAPGAWRPPSAGPPSTSAACGPACAAPKPRPTAPWPAMNSRCCWPWKSPRTPSATTASASNAWSPWCASRKPPAQPPNRPP